MNLMRFHFALVFIGILIFFITLSVVSRQGVISAVTMITMSVVLFVVVDLLRVV